MAQFRAGMVTHAVTVAESLQQMTQSCMTVDWLTAPVAKSS